MEQRIDSLLARMTLEEKIGQMNLLNADADRIGPQSNLNYREDIKKGLVGAIYFYYNFDVQKIKELQKLAVEESRLGIPLLFGHDVIHGHKTIFPVPIGQAASWDLELIEQSVRISAIEAAAQGINWTFAPMVDIARDARWGRIMEGSGEDPYLGAQIAAVKVRGYQGNDLSQTNTILACAKHYAAYGAAEGGLDYNTVDISARTLRQVYLPPFEAAVHAGAATIMSAFNEIAGVPSTANQLLLKKILRDDWNFEGFVVSDWDAINEMIHHGVAANAKQATELAIKAGCDMDMVALCYIDELVNLVKAKKIEEKVIDNAVKRILRMKFNLGLMDDPFRYLDVIREKELLLRSDHLETARDLARKSIVLLKNDDKLLPLKKDIKTIAVIGPLADNKRDLMGNWCAQGEARHVITLLEGIKNAVSPATKVKYSKGCDINDQSTQYIKDAVDLARSADVIILAVGESWDMSGENMCRVNLELPGVQHELITSIHKLGKPTIAVIMSGRPLVITWMSQNIPAILEAWLPGTEGGHAIADVLFGDYNPSAKLPVSFPYATGQVPIYYNRKNTGRPSTKYIDAPREPLYPFGFGQSYTRFEYSDLILSKNTISMDDTLLVSVKVRNIGEYSGEEIIQLYIQDLVATVTRPIKELKGFQKIKLSPGEFRTVTFKLTKDDLFYYDINMNLTVEPGDFKIYVGANSMDALEANLKLE